MPAWWGDWGVGKKVLHDFAVRVTSQLISIGAAERCWKAYAHIHCECPKRTRNRLGPERAPKLVRVHYNLRLRRKRSSPEYDDVHLPAMTIDPIEEAADDPSWKTTQISKLKAGSFVEAGPHGDCTELGESEPRSDIPSPWDSGSGRWGQCQWASIGTAPAPRTQAGSQGLSGTMGRD
jgi:hypothetical protein